MHNCPEAVIVAVNFLLSYGGDESTSTLTSTSTSHPPAAIALCDGRRCCRPCLPPRRRSGRMSNPSATTASRDRLRPCLPPRRRSTSRFDVDVASYHCHRHARSLSLSSSPSLSPPPFDVAHPRHILRRHRLARSSSSSSSPSLSLSPPPVDVARRRRILPPSPLCAIVVFILVVPAASAVRDNCCRPRRLSMSTPKSHPPAAATALRNNRHRYCRP
jgi:hypothetical protein